MHILIIYGSLEGQTKKIAERIAEILATKGHQVTNLAADTLAADFSVNNFDAAIVGGSIHIGNYPKQIPKFISKYRGWLNNVPGALFTVCMAINSQQTKSREQAVGFGDKLISQTGWRPVLTETFAGAVKYTQYGFITRFIMKNISKREGGSTDTTRDHEYTDWDRVTQFADAFAAALTERQKNRLAEAEMD